MLLSMLYEPNGEVVKALAYEMIITLMISPASFAGEDEARKALTEPE